MHCHWYHIIQKSNRLQIWWKQLVCLSKCFETSRFAKKKGLRSVNMKFSGPVLIEIKVMQPLSRLFWCTLLKTRLSSIFLWHSPFLTQKARLLCFLFLFLAESLIALKGFTIFSLFCLCPLLRAVAGVQRSSQLLFTSFWRETAIGWNQCDPL